MISTILSAMQPMATNDYVGFTFFVGCMAMMAASAFFFLSMSSVEGKWKTSLLVSGLITFIAAVHYFYMRDYWASVGESPTFFRYVDWTLTVPLMCVEFYLILKAAGAKTDLLWKLIGASVVMLVTGYFGEAVYQDAAWLWGLFSGLAYFYIVYLIFAGEAKQLANASSPAVQKAHNILCKFVLIGWAIYPLGYMVGTGVSPEVLNDAGQAVGGNVPQWYSFLDGALAMDVIYNIGDAINKIGFGLVIYALAVSDDK
ncbi:MAG: bacteriorhodopsin-like [Bacteroidota bacterium]|nr:bacteriorhodopsin-like [Bacteroidota bacterium]